MPTPEVQTLLTQLEKRHAPQAMCAIELLRSMTSAEDLAAAARDEQPALGPVWLSDVGGAVNRLGAGIITVRDLEGRVLAHTPVPLD